MGLYGEGGVNGANSFFFVQIDASVLKNYAGIPPELLAVIITLLLFFSF